LGVKIDLMNYDSTIDLMQEVISKRIFGKYICACPVHPLMASLRDRKLKQALNNSWLTVPDGMPVAWAARMLGASIKDRVYGPNLMLRVCSSAEKHGHTIFLYGGKPSTLKNLERTLLERFPHLRIAGVHSPPFRELSPSEDRKIIGMINSALPDVLFIGLGAPKQEKWMLSHCEKIKVPVTVGVGAAFDFLSGEKRQAPAWMQAHGLEWFYRLLNEPRRLWSRYLINNPLFVLLFLGQLLGVKLRLTSNETYTRS
jgi:N-acetylglucosaminyldiphosphoundecaprenol N-acetyl-beta-D-mannosaminyltransferase